MITITHNGTTKRISENVLKISDYLKFQYDNIAFSEAGATLSRSEEAIPFLEHEDETFKIFMEWFDVLDNVLTKSEPQDVLTKSEPQDVLTKSEPQDVLTKSEPQDVLTASQTFNHKFFKDYSIEQKIKLFNFALGNQFKILCETIAFCLKDEKIYENFICGSLHDNHFEAIEINYVLKNMILKYKNIKHEPDNNPLDVWNESSNDLKFELRYYEIYNVWRMFGINILMHGLNTGLNGATGVNQNKARNKLLKLAVNKHKVDGLTALDKKLKAKGVDLTALYFRHNLGKYKNDLIMEYNLFPKHTFNENVISGTFKIKNTFKNFVDVLFDFENCKFIKAFIEDYINFKDNLIDIYNKILITNKELLISQPNTKKFYKVLFENTTNTANELQILCSAKFKPIIKQITKLFKMVGLEITDEIKDKLGIIFE